MSIRKKAHQATLNNVVPAPAKNRKSPADTRNGKAAREFTWDLVAINIHLEDIRRIWAELLGVSGPQWLILMAISELDSGEGVSVGDVSGKIHVHSTFVTTQTKSLERSGFLTRVTSPSDARIVLMSLTDKARKEIASLSVRRDDLSDFIFSDMSDRTLREVSEALKLIRRRAEKAVLQLDIDIT